MGQTLQTLSFGDEKEKEINPIIAKCYDKHFKDSEEWNSAKFYQAICKTVEKINKHLGSTQFHVPEKKELKKVYDKHYGGKRKSLTKKEFQKMLQEVIIKTKFKGTGAMDILLYIFGVPVTALLIKQRVAPKAGSNEILIPAVTSATVLLLAQLNKI